MLSRDEKTRDFVLVSSRLEISSINISAKRRAHFSRKRRRSNNVNDRPTDYRQFLSSMESFISFMAREIKIYSPDGIDR